MYVIDGCNVMGDLGLLRMVEAKEIKEAEARRRAINVFAARDSLRGEKIIAVFDSRRSWDNKYDERVIQLTDRKAIMRFANDADDHIVFMAEQGMVFVAVTGDRGLQRRLSRFPKVKIKTLDDFFRKLLPDCRDLKKRKHKRRRTKSSFRRPGLH